MTDDYVITAQDERLAAAILANVTTRLLLQQEVRALDKATPAVQEKPNKPAGGAAA